MQHEKLYPLHLRCMTGQLIHLEKLATSHLSRMRMSEIQITHSEDMRVACCSKLEGNMVALFKTLNRIEEIQTEKEHVT